MVASYSVNNRCLSKILLHALKHPFGSCNGLLIGRATERKGDNGEKGSSNINLEFIDAFPVSHTYPGLTGIMEIALAQLDAYCEIQNKKEAEGQKIQVLGYYQCNEMNTNTKLGAVGEAIADSVHRVGAGQSVSFVLNANELKSSVSSGKDGANPLILYRKGSNNSWTVDTGSRVLVSMKDLADKLPQYVRSGLTDMIVDFEEHLENISKDWLNKDLLQ